MFEQKQIAQAPLPAPKKQQAKTGHSFLHSVGVPQANRLAAKQTGGSILNYLNIYFFSVNLIFIELSSLLSFNFLIFIAFYFILSVKKNLYFIICNISCSTSDFWSCLYFKFFICFVIVAKQPVPNVSSTLVN